MFCCLRPTLPKDDPSKAGPSTAAAATIASGNTPVATITASSSRHEARHTSLPHSMQSDPSQAHRLPPQGYSSSVLAAPPYADAGPVGPGAAAVAAAGDSVRGSAAGAAAAGAEDGTHEAQNGMLQLVSLLQELLALATTSPKQPLSRAMGLLVLRLPVDWACLHAISSTGHVVMQVGAALSPAALRQRGASGSAAYATPVLSSSGRRQLGYGQVMPLVNSTGGVQSAAGSGSTAQEHGAGHLQVLPGSSSSLELVAGSRQALALYAGDEDAAAHLPKDWQRLHKDRDLRSFLAVPIIATGSSGSIIGALSFGLTAISDWGAAWWMSSIQLLCGWAAGALPQYRTTAKACFFDAVWNAANLDGLASAFVHHLPLALVDLSSNQLEVRLALVSSRQSNCVIFASEVTSGSDASQARQQAADQQERQHDGQEQPQLPQHQHEQDQHDWPSNSSKLNDLGHSTTANCARSLGGAGLLDTAVPEDVTLTGFDNTGLLQPTSLGTQGTDVSVALQHLSSSTAVECFQQQQQQHQEGVDPAGSLAKQAEQRPVVRINLPTANSVLLSALEWGEVMVVKDTVTYFGRNASSGAVRDLFLPDRPLVQGTLVLLPLQYRCRPLGCVYLLAPWDIHAAFGKAALQELAALLSAGTFKALLARGPVQQEWYSHVLSEGPMPVTPALVFCPPAGSDAASGRGSGEASLEQTPHVSSLAVPEAASKQPATAAAVGSNGFTAATKYRSPAATEIGSVVSDGPTNAAAVSSTSLDSSWAAGEQDGMPQGAGNSFSATTASSGAESFCPLLPTAPRSAAADTMVSAAAPAAATVFVPVGLSVSGHAAGMFPKLALWPELLDIKEDLARSRHTAVYIAEHAGQVLAVKLYRYPSSMDLGHYPQHHLEGSMIAGSSAAGVNSLSGVGAGPSGGSSAGKETELETVLRLQYKLCSLQHEHILQHIAVYPRVYEVVHRRSSREPADVYLASSLPRKDRHHRCAAVVTAQAGGGCLRDAVNKGAVHVPTATALQAAAGSIGLPLGIDVTAFGSQQLQELVAQFEQQLPLLPPLPVRGSLEQPPTPSAGVMSSMSALAAAPGLHLRHQHMQQLREPCMSLLQLMLLHIALGMQHLHACGIIHGELRLDNVMIDGKLPSTVELVQLQQKEEKERSGQTTASAALGQQQQQQQPPLESLTEDSEAVQLQTGVPAGTAGFSLKLKDIGLCTVGWQHKQVSVRKLAGRPRLQAVSWLAPECFKGASLSKQTDVYAFGILMWELYTGQVAFSDLATGNVKVLQTVISEGGRPQFPVSTPMWYATLATRCWSASVKGRPSFRRIVAQLQAGDITQ